MTNSSPPSGTLYLTHSTPNPNGVPGATLYLLVGDATAGRIRQIIPQAGADLPPARTDLAQQPFRLRVLHFNDMHGHLSRFTPHGDRPVFSKMVWRIRQICRARQHDPNAAVITLSAGDDLVGAVFDELLGDDPDSFVTHAGYRLYAAAGLDACALGNHDLDMGTHLLAQAISRDANFPVLSANLVGSRWLAGLTYPAAVLVVKGVRVGLIGLTTPAAIRPQIDSGLNIVNPVQVVHNLLPALRPLCDVLIIVSHLGYSLAQNPAVVSEAGDVELARSLPPDSVHLIVGGHTHHVLNEQGLTANNIVNRIPIVQAGSLGRFLGEVDITLQYSAAVTSVRLSQTADFPVDESFEQTHVQPVVALAQPLFERKLGPVVDHPDLETDEIRNAFAAHESALANFTADALVTRCRANGHNVDIAVVDSSCIRIGLPVGQTLTFGDWFNVMPFADTIRICWVTGAQLKALLDDNARRIDYPGEPHTERGFLHFSRQLRYKIYPNAGRPDARAADITVNDIPLDEQLERSFLIACSSFVRKSAAAWEKYRGARFERPDMKTWPHLETPLFLRNEMVTYIRENGGVTKESGAQRDGRLVIER